MAECPASSSDLDTNSLVLRSAGKPGSKVLVRGFDFGTTDEQLHRRHYLSSLRQLVGGCKMDWRQRSDLLSVATVVLQNHCRRTRGMRCAGLRVSCFSPHVSNFSGAIEAEVEGALLQSWTDCSWVRSASPPKPCKKQLPAVASLVLEL